MKIKPIISNEFKITTILTKRKYHTDYLVHYLTKQFKDKEVMLWQSSNCYMPCKRIELGFDSDLIDLLHYYKDEFDVLIVYTLKDTMIIQETISFINEFKQSKDFADKQLIILVAARRGADTKIEEVKLEDYVNLKDTIIKCSDNIYKYERKDCISQFVVENLKTKETTNWRTYSESVITTLCSDD